ncbi:MAG: class A beta-lactamase-related serine hydrolase [Actinomycetota bacterium]|nr:class A beta-lactamase-related serine hydrolase [Actinomycetota bacterium]
MARPRLVTLAALSAVGRRLDAGGGTVSVWYGPPGGAAVYARLPAAPHHAASTIKLALLVAVYRLADTGCLDLNSTVRVRPEFASVSGARFRLDRGYDNDEEPWERLGESASLRWLAGRMIVRSSNLATNLLLDQVGLPAVAEALVACGARDSAMRRPICDDAAASAGTSNVVTAADLAAVLGALADGRAASPAACAEMLEVLAAQEYLDGIPAGLPPATQVASKGGWVDEVLHDAALVRPDDAPPYVLVVCTTGVAGAADLIPEIAAATWADRHSLGQQRWVEDVSTQQYPG